MPKRTHQRAPSSQSFSRDNLTGNCMTCSSLMRWPKNIEEFRCTICETINDLKPLTEKQQPDNGNEGEPISPRHTKKLVNDCLRNFLTAALCNRKREDDGKLSEASERHQRHELAYAQTGLEPVDASMYKHKFTFSEEPTLRRNPPHPTLNFSRKSSLLSERPLGMQESSSKTENLKKKDDSATIFKPVQDYLVSCFQSFDSISNSFCTSDFRHPIRQRSDSRATPSSRDPRLSGLPSGSSEKSRVDHPICNVEPKLLLLGDVAKNGTWWVGGQDCPSNSRVEGPSKTRSRQKSPHIDWQSLDSWYYLIMNPTEDWPIICTEIAQRPDYINPSDEELRVVEQNLAKAQSRLRKVLMKVTENALKRPGGKITEAEQLRFFLILLENPLLHADSLDEDDHEKTIGKTRDLQGLPSNGPLSGRHSRIVKRVIGLIANLDPDLHSQLSIWWSRYQINRFTKTKELVSGFLTYRLLRQEAKRQGNDLDVLGDLIPQLQPGRPGAFLLHDEITSRRSQRSQKNQQTAKPNGYLNDWQVGAASRVLSLLFDANNPYSPNRHDDAASWSGEVTDWKPSVAKGLFLPMSDFYITLADYVDLINDFVAWEGKSQKFTFCQYPFLLSIWAKTQILENEWKKQMQGMAREAFFDSIMRGRNITQFLSLTVRRECLVEDSLKAIGESLGSATEDAKKALRVQFKGEEGIDGGGLRKEWFLLLVREVFSPEMGLFKYDEDSNYCYFNPYSFENTDQFFLVGAVLGLAIYNSIILDVALPPFMFRKLLSTAPSTAQPSTLTHVRQHIKYRLDDLAQFRPQLAKGLKQLLEFDGDVETVFCADFVIDVEKYDTTVRVPLCDGGEKRAVTNKNRREYVDLYIQYLLDTSVVRQFEPFKRGFYSVCSGNAFNLFRPEEVELLVRGSDEQLDVASLRGLAEYDNWDCPSPDGTEPVVSWFWEVFREASPKDQRKLLLFITGSDRLPAAGASLAPLRLSCLGDDCGHFPIARTCFNLLSIWRYGSKEKLRSMLWRAVYDSEGFGLK